jgi:membrane fusion protein, adhesin transport system
MTHLEDLPDRIKPRLASNLLLWGILLFFAIFLVWAYFAKIERTVRAQGRVIPSSELQIISSNEPGVIEDILVRPGQVVVAGAELLRLDPTISSSELGSGQATFNALEVKIARLQAEVEGREPSYPASTDQATSDQIQTERALHASRMADLASLTEAAQAHLLAAQRAITEAQAAYEARSATATARAQEAAVLRPLVDRGIEPRMSLMQAESAAGIARSEAASAAASVARVQASAGEARAALAQARQNWRAQAATELATAQAEIAARRRSLPALQERVQRTILRAPLAGRVNRVLVTTRGSAVQAAQPLLEIVPSNESLVIEARVRPEDISFVRMDQPAKVALTAYDRSIYGTMDGTVIGISPDAVTDAKTEQSFYIVRVRTSSNQLHAPNGEILPIGPGMVAEVDLLGDPRTVLEYLLTPITRLNERALRDR